jgi:purine-binding chemotaxis protein CheW
MQIEEILIISNTHEHYGISTNDINQISRVPSLMELPLRPQGSRGLCSVGGSIVSMIDMNLLLGGKEVDIDALDSRLLTLNNTLSSNALLVSEVYNTIEINKDNIEYLENEDDPVIAIYRDNETLIQILSLENLFDLLNKIEIESKEVKDGKLKELVQKEKESKRFLIFSMGKENFALEIDYLQEIILANIEFTELAGSSDEVMGLITLRDELLLTIDLRKYYGFEPINRDYNRILVVSYNNKKVCLYIDSIIDIQNFYIDDIEYMKDSFASGKVSGVIHTTSRLISFFDNEVIEDIFKKNEAYIDSHISSDEEQDEDSTKEVIVFKLLSKEYAFDVSIVDEIIDVVSSTDIAFTDDDIDGIINIRGQIVTIVSLFKKLNIKSYVNEDSKIIVCNIDGDKIGFVVDSVSDILDVKETEIKEEDDEYFESVLYLDNGNRLVLSIDLDKIIDTRE